MEDKCRPSESMHKLDGVEVDLNANVDIIPWRALKNGCNIPKSPMLPKKNEQWSFNDIRNSLKECNVRESSEKKRSGKICYSKEKLLAIRYEMPDFALFKGPILTDFLTKALVKTSSHEDNDPYFLTGISTILKELEKQTELYDKEEDLYEMYLTIDDYIVKASGSTYVSAKKMVVSRGVNIIRRKNAGEAIWKQPLLALNLPLIERVKFIIDRRAFIKRQENNSRFLPTDGMLTSIERQYLDEIDEKLSDCVGLNNKTSVFINGKQVTGTGSSALAARDDAILIAFLYIKNFYETKGLQNDILNDHLVIRIESRDDVC